MNLTWLGHSTWLFEDADSQQRAIIDPFITDNPAATIDVGDVPSVQQVWVTHAHFDHIGDVALIAKRCDAQVVGCFEVTAWFEANEGLTGGLGMNCGGSTTVPLGRLQFVPAVHSSSFPDGSYGGVAGGFVLHPSARSGKRIYIAGDTAVFGDMQQIAGGVDVAILPIGDLYTMGIDDSIQAIRLINPKVVLPTHHGTWPPITVDTQLWADRVRAETNAQPIVLEVGESYTLL
ncbi:MAG: metal-dependent hydrolase [Planctomycetota bacterium]